MHPEGQLTDSMSLRFRAAAIGFAARRNSVVAQLCRNVWKPADGAPGALDVVDDLQAGLEVGGEDYRLVADLERRAGE
jgi:hypothetical protein